MAEFQAYTIVCASLAHLSDETNVARNWLVECFLRDLKVPYERTVGHYKGAYERGFILYGKGRVAAAMAVTRALQQETFLHATGPQTAALVNADNTAVQRFTRCEHCAADEPFWTRVGDGRCFVWR